MPLSEPCLYNGDHRHQNLLRRPNQQPSLPSKFWILRRRQKNKADKGQNITFNMEKVMLENGSYICGQMSLLTGAESTVRLMQAVSFHPLNPLPHKQECGSQSQAPVSSRICVPKRKGWRAEPLLPGSSLQTYQSKEALCFLRCRMRVGQRRAKNISISHSQARGKKHRVEGNRVCAPKTIILTSQEADLQGFKGDASESDRPGFASWCPLTGCVTLGEFLHLAKPHL